MANVDLKEIKYEVKLSSDFIPSNDVFVYLYEPLLGSKPSALYHLLYTEAKNQLVENSKIERLISIMRTDKTKLIKILNKLELVGLVDLYKKKDNDGEVTFVLNKPLTVTRFISNKQFTESLKEKIGEENFNKNVNHLSKTVFELTNEFESVNEDEEKTIEIQIQFNTDPIKKLLELAGHDLDWWNDEANNEIVKVILVNDLDNMIVAEMISEILKEKGVFNIEDLEERIKDSPLDEEIIDKLENELEQSIESKIQLLSQLDPRDFIKMRVERPATTDEKKMIKELSKVSKFPNEFINFLIDFSAIKNNGAINVNYITKIAKTIIEKEIDDIQSLVTWLQTAYSVSERKERNLKGELPSVKIEDLRNTDTSIELIEEDIKF